MGRAIPQKIRPFICEAQSQIKYGTNYKDMLRELAKLGPRLSPRLMECRQLDCKEIGILWEINPLLKRR